MIDLHNNLGADVLYNISFRINDTESVLVPRVPYSIGDDGVEDAITRRVCLSDSVEGCLKAISPSFRDMRVGAEIIVRSVPTKELRSSYLINYLYLFYTAKVMDAYETHEFWYLDNLDTKVEKYIVRDFDYEHTINWSCINKARMRDVLSQCGIEACGITAEDMYRNASALLMKKELYDDYDELDDKIAMIPWARGLSFKNVQLELVT